MHLVMSVLCELCLGTLQQDISPADASVLRVTLPAEGENCGAATVLDASRVFLFAGAQGKELLAQARGGFIVVWWVVRSGLPNFSPVHDSPPNSYVYAYTARKHGPMQCSQGWHGCGFSCRRPSTARPSAMRHSRVACSLYMHFECDDQSCAWKLSQ